MSSNQYNGYPGQGEINTLLEFINRLGNASRGISGDIDKHLAKIKSLTDTNTLTIDALKPHFDAVMQALQREQGRVEHTMREVHLGSISALRHLLDYEKLVPGSKEQTSQLLERLQAPLHSYSELLPLMLNVIERFQAELSSNVRPFGERPSAAHYQALQGELTNLLATIDFRSAASNTLQSLRQRLLQVLNGEQLLNACMDALRLIIQGINEERQSAQQFLLSLSDALSSVNKALTRAVQTHDDNSEEQAQLSLQLQARVQNLASSVNTASSLQELKHQVQGHINDISELLVDKLAREQSERQSLRNQLSTMQARLEDVESEAQMYKRKLSEQKFKSLQDSLTRLPNRAAFEERLELEYQRWQSYAAPLAIAIADIDHFKVINDTYGHTAGDKTLQVIANMLKKSLRDTDFVCRYGGEEFVIVFPQTTTEVAFELLEKARHRIKSIPFKFKNTSISITISAGVSSFVAQDNPARVFERADRALYLAKNEGRDRVSQQ